MNEQKVQNTIIQRNKKVKNFDKFHEEQNHSEHEHEHHYGFKKLDSNSSMGNKTIHKHGSSKNVILKMNEIINDYPEKYYHQHLKSDWLKFFVNLFISLFHIVIFFLYINSINACSKNLTLDECIEKININYYYKVYLLCFITASLISLIIVLMINKFASIIHSIFIVLELIIFISINHENNIYKNGLFSFRLLCSFIVTNFLFLLCFVYFLIRLSKRQYFYAVFFFFFFFLLAILIRFSCIKWPRGLNNVKVDNDPSLYACEFKEPTQCHMDFLSSILDFSNLLGIDCQKENPLFDEVEQVWIDYFSNNEFVEEFKGLAYPSTNNINYTFNKFGNEQDFADKINENIFFLKENNIFEGDKYEIKLLKNKQNFDIDINLIYNERLSQSRNEIMKDKTVNNILFIYIDSLSRSHFFRKMKMVSSFLEKYYKSSKNVTNYESFQFMKYQTFKRDYYKPSIQTIFYNKTKDNFYQYIHILSLLKEYGYITGQTANICSKEFYSYDFEKVSNFFKKTIIEEYDHENIAMFCDPFYFDYKNSNRKNVKGINSSIKSCLYGKNSFEYVLEYGYQFWSKYKKNKRFLRLGFFDGNERTGEVIKYLDNYLYEFLNKLHQENLLQNTILFIVSGQGNTQTEFFTNFYDDFWMEKYIGTLFLFIDKTNIPENDNCLINIRNNQQTMVTPYDIKETLESIILNNFCHTSKEKETKLEEMQKKGKNLFSYINSKDRNCHKYKQLTEEVCRCHDF